MVNNRKIDGFIFHQTNINNLHKEGSELIYKIAGFIYKFPMIGENIDSSKAIIINTKTGEVISNELV